VSNPKNKTLLGETGRPAGVILGMPTLWLALKALGMGILAFAYLAGLRKWVYQGKLGMGLAAVLLAFPALIALTGAYPATLLRGIPLVGVGMFLHHYRARILMQIKLLWFTTLSMIVVQGYYACYAHFVLGR
jgi:hypothetical protein